VGRFLKHFFAFLTQGKEISVAPLVKVWKLSKHFFALSTFVTDGNFLGPSLKKGKKLV
jgi:hypothetical protein